MKKVDIDTKEPTHLGLFIFLIRKVTKKISRGSSFVILAYRTCNS